MTTANDLVTQALKKAGILGVGQTALAEDANDALADLNDMLALWQRKRWMVWHLVDVAFTSTGSQSYAVSIGGSFNVPRPDRIQAGFFRLLNATAPNQVDYPAELIQSREDYNAIALKSLSTFPRYMFYDAAYPTGYLFCWPVPQAFIWEIHISVKEQLGQLASLATTANLPPEYFAAIKFSLAQRLRQAYQMPADPELNALARDAMNTIRGANAQIPRLRMPTDLVRGGVYNPYSDQFR